MKRILSPKLPRPGHPVELPAQEAHHAVQVLRLRDGQRIEVMDGNGKSAIAALRVRGKSVWVDHVEDPVAGSAEESAPIVLELAVLKGEAMEWAVEKAVELGVERLVPVLAAHTVVQTGKKGPESFADRWQKIADQALKQCGRLRRLEVAIPVALEELLAAEPARPSEPRLWCDETSRGEAPSLFQALAEGETPTTIRILVGPEGGWSERERELLGVSACRRTSLGPLTLRAETAALFAASVAAAWLRERARQP